MMLYFLKHCAVGSLMLCHSISVKVMLPASESTLPPDACLDDVQADSRCSVLCSLTWMS